MIHIHLGKKCDSVARRAGDVLQAEFNRLWGADARISSRPDRASPRILLDVDTAIPEQGFHILRADDGAAKVVGGDGRGVLYGCGKLLRMTRVVNGEVIWPESQPISAPAMPYRGMYLAVHAHNFYHNAPIKDVCRYIEQLALWGINTLSVYFHLFHFNGLEDPACQEFVARLKTMFATAREVGMATTLLVTANDGYLNTPEALRYVGDVPRNWGGEICPSNPEGLALIKSNFEEVFSQFEDVDNLILWGYDSGGCLCSECRPWGANGYYNVSREVARLFKKAHPKGKVIFSTWYFDYNLGVQGEWDELFRRLDSGKLDWADMLLADGAFCNGYFPQQVMDRPAPKPVISFLEISMKTGAPWGGFGSNPMPRHIQSEWDRQKAIVMGGNPYSEGIYEDVNKILWAQLTWAPDRSCRDILREYAASEFSAEHADRIVSALELMESVGRYEPLPECGGVRIQQTNAESVDRVFKIISEVDAQLPPRVREGWRWRVVFLRALIDEEFKSSGGRPTEALARAFEELETMYWADERTIWFVRPYRIGLKEAGGQRAMVFMRFGLDLNDICPYRSSPHEDTATSAAERQDVRDAGAPA